MDPDSTRSSNVVALYEDEQSARRAAEALRNSGIDDERISVENRRLTDEATPSPEDLAPVADPITTTRDAQAARAVVWRSVLVSGAVALVGAAIGFFVGWPLYGLPSLGVLITTIVGFVAGSVVGAVWGGAFGAMDQGRKEQGALVGVQSRNAEELASAERILREHGAVRVETSPVEHS